jgi:dephospho-CoA kinase
MGSAIRESFPALALTTVEADKLVDYKVGSEVTEKVRAAFPSACGDGGVVDRRALGGIVFKSERDMAVLEGIVWPHAESRLKDIISFCGKSDSRSVVLLESAVLQRCGWSGLCDHVIRVTTPEALAMKRIMSRDRLSQNDAGARIELQRRQGEGGEGGRGGDGEGEGEGAKGGAEGLTSGRDSEHVVLNDGTAKSLRAKGFEVVSEIINKHSEAQL